MNPLDAVVSRLAEHGPMLCFGSTLVLAAGVLAVRLCRAPAQRRRLGVLTALATAAYLLCAALPLPRLAWPRGTVTPPPGGAAPAAKAPAPPAERAAAIERALAQLDGDVLRAGTSAPSARNTAAPPPPGVAWSWSLVATLVYLAGAAFVLLRLAAGSIRLRLLLASCAPVPAADVRGVELPPRVRLLATARDVRPFCTGALRPVIVVPRSLLEPARRAQAIAVIRHEAAHVRSRDPSVQALLALLAIPLFWHPLLWWLARDVRFHSELLADDAAAGAGRTGYARALLQLAERAQPELRGLGTVAIFHRPSEFFRRIQMLLQREGSLSTSISRRQRAGHALAALTLVAASAGVFGVDASAQEPKPSAAREAELRDTIATLRADLAALRAQLETLQAERAALPGHPAAGGVAPPKEVTFGEYQDHLRASLRAAEPRTQPVPPPTPQAYDLRIGDEVFTYELQPAPGAGTPPPDSPFPPGTGPAGAPSAFGPRFGLVTPPAATPHPHPFVGSLLVPDSGDSHAAAATADLASRYLDLQAEIEIAETTAEETRRLTAAGVASATEAKRAAVNLRTLQRKLALVDKLLHGEIAATEAEVAWLSAEHDRVAQHERGRVEAQLQRARMRLEAMHSVR